MISSDLFDEVRRMPDDDAARQFGSLVGLDRLKEAVLKQARLAVNPDLAERWSEEHHGSVLPCVERFNRRPPLMVFYGDVGTGKTTLADSLGDPVARSEGIGVTVLRLSLVARGQGAVGQMTKLISQAFDEAADLAKRGRRRGKKPGSAVILVIDEADALAESRDTEQMHHEDRAGVNALIRGIDRFGKERLPALVVMCTNRHGSLDPAILRRTAIGHEFKRPNAEQREALLRGEFGGTFTDGQYAELARLTGPANGGCGHTFSDITQRIVPNAILEAFPGRPVSFDCVASVIKDTKPTPPFGRGESPRPPG